MQQKKNIYFVGAGGIGMAALERYFKARGYNVGGYDRTPTDLTRALENEGIAITYDDSAEAIPESFRNPADTLVVYTPAVPDSHPGLAWFRANGFEVVKRAAVLGLVTRHSKALCFSGTHGKTTTSSMAAHLLHSSPCGCNAFLGGVLRNYNTNFLLNDASPYSVVEADEYDRSFHHLSPFVAVVTATDPDHLDIYGTEEAYLESFAHFTELIQPGGVLIKHTGLKLRERTDPSVKIYTYSRDEGDFHAENIRRGNGSITFDFVAPDGETIRNIELGVPVEINITNAIAALAAVWAAGELTPDVAIVDPQFVMSVPKSVTADTGMDVLTHAIEAYVSVLASDYTDGLALHAIRMVFKYLKRAYDNGADKEARERMHNASCIAGMAFTNAFLGINHSLAHKLGSAYHIPHGRANAILLPYVIAYNAQRPTKFATWPKYEHFIADKRYAEIAEALGLPCSTTQEGVASLIKAITDLQDSMNVPRSIQSQGVDEKTFLANLDEVADEAHADQCTPANPRYPLISELKEILLQAYYGPEGKK